VVSNEFGKFALADFEPKTAYLASSIKGTTQRHIQQTRGSSVPSLFD
jgi:hypothetical protein